MSNGFIFYRGPSMLDGSPIVAIATGLERPSQNEKTGGMVQTFIIRDDMSPLEAIDTGADDAICGDCIHRSGPDKDRDCYVDVAKSVQSVWHALQRNSYPTLSLREARIMLAGLRVRMGAYGDPAAVPAAVWGAIMPDTEAHTGYTQQWRLFPELRLFVMASCNTVADFIEAKRLGWRTYRVRTAAQPLQRSERACPASDEAGHKVQCIDCVGCGGLGARAEIDYAIIVHGPKHKVAAFERFAA